GAGGSTRSRRGARASLRIASPKLQPRRTAGLMMSKLFENFVSHRIKASGAEINLVTGGKGPPLLLLHGYPQTHAMWHRIAPRLAQHFTVICADLRGYGDSGKPMSEPDHCTYSKRAMAQDQVDVMQALGFERFALAGHD